MNKQQQKKLLTEIMNEDAKDVLYDNKAFTIGKVREIMDSWEQGQISYGRMVEMLNDIAIKWHENHIGGSNKMVEHHIVDTNKMMTAVDWLINKFNYLRCIHADDIEDGYSIESAIKIAKEMEKEQIENAYGDGQENGIECQKKLSNGYDCNVITSIQYYNETYNK
jgi:hypothetical protein